MADVWLSPSRATRDAGARDGTALRWRFCHLTADSFTWQAKETPPGGQPWVRQRFAAT